MRRINILESHIGDAITSFPALYDLADREGLEVYFASSGVRDLWKNDAAAVSREKIEGGEDFNNQLAFKIFSYSGLHMAQAWYWILSMPIPQFIRKVGLSESNAAFLCDVIISPFSHSDLLLSERGEFGGKTWPFEKWNKVIDALTGAGFSVGVCGTFASGTDPAFWGDRRITVLDSLPLNDLCGCVRGARCVATIDNGIGHIAHLLGVSHVHLIPNKPWISPKEWTMNKNENAEIIYEDFSLLGITKILYSVFSVLSKFDDETYFYLNKDVSDTSMSAWQHYTIYGKDENRKVNLD